MRSGSASLPAGFVRASQLQAASFMMLARVRCAGRGPGGAVGVRVRTAAHAGTDAHACCNNPQLRKLGTALLRTHSVASGINAGACLA
jgi:hypothetical protein